MLLNASGGRSARDDAGTLHAFLSYSHADRRAAAALHAYLEDYPLPGGSGRLRVFLDETDIRSGELSDELGAALQGAQALVVCCSPSSTESRWVGQEIEAFLRHGRRPVVPIVLAGDPAAVVPAALREREYRYLDLRRRWCLGRLDPKGRIELARGIATILGRPLRDLVDWERRRQRRFALAGCAAAVAASIVAAFYPLDYQRDLQVGDVIGPLRSLEFSEVRGEGLLLAAREQMLGPQGGRDYVAIYPDVLASRAWKWLGVDRFEFRARLLAAPATGGCRRGAGGGPLFDAVRAESVRLAAERVRESADQAPWLEGANDASFAPRGPWVGRPMPGLTVALCVVPPMPADPADLAEGYAVASAGVAVVGVAEQGQAPVVARVDGLDPEPPRSADPRSADLLRAPSVAVSAHGLWLGARARDDGRGGGLWRSTDRGRTWTRVEGFSSVGSILVDPRVVSRVLVAKAPGRWKSGVREGVLAAGIVVQDQPGAPWRPLTPAPPHGSASQIQLAGFFGDGALVVQVDGAVYELGRDNLARRLPGWHRRVARRSEDRAPPRP